MTLNRRQPEEGSKDDYEPQPNVLSSTSTDEPAGVSTLARGAIEVMIIQTLQRYVGPLIMPLIRQVVKEQIELAKQEILASMKDNQVNRAITSVPRKLKVQFRNKVSLPVYTGKPLMGEKGTPIKIALVDAITGEIVKTGPESMAKLEIVGFRVGDTDNESNDDSWTFEDFHRRVLSEKKGKRTLQGNTCLQLKEGVCCFVDTISFTHSSEPTRNGRYRLGAGVVDVALMNQVDVAMTEAFLMKDGRALYSEKHTQPSLIDKVRHLQQIGSNRYKRLEDAGVITVKDLLIILYTNPKRLEEILKLKPTSKMWDNIVKNAQASSGMFLYLDPSNEQKTGVVLDVKLQLKALIVEPRHYIPVDRLSEKQKVDSQHLVKVASEHLKSLKACEDEASAKKYLMSVHSFRSLPSLQVTHSSPGLLEALNDLNNSNHLPLTMVTSQSERGKEKVLFDDVMIYSTTYHQEHLSFNQSNIHGTNGLNFGASTEPGTSSQAVGSLHDTCIIDQSLVVSETDPSDDVMTYSRTRYHENISSPPPNIGSTNGINFGTTTEPGTSSQAVGRMNTCIFDQSLEISEDLEHLLSFDYNSQSPNREWHSSPTNSDISAVIRASETVPVSTIAQIRWTKASTLLTRYSLRARISLSEGFQPLKKQKCF